MKNSVLLVDDEQANLDALTRLFRKDYKVFAATSGQQALDILRAEDIHLIISDQRMPKMTGVEFLAQSMAVRPEAIRILLTGYADIESLISAINNGQIYGYVTKPWDSTDLKNTVAKGIEKYELRRELENKNRALAQAVEQLKELDEAKTRFMMLVNHELKTPLTGISSFLELLQETPLNEEQKLFASHIRKNTDRLHKMIEDVLQLISARTGLLEVRPTELASTELISNLVATFSEAASKRKLRLVVENQAEKFIADRGILTKVLWQLTDNAIKFAEEASEVRVSAQSSDGGVEFQIENRGNLNPDKVDQILEPFSLDENMMNHSGGLGLGLSISDALLKRHRSRLKIESGDGKVKMTFRLPPSE